MRTLIGPEIQCLITFCSPVTKGRELQAGLQGISDWGRFLHLAAQHGIIAMVRTKIHQEQLQGQLPKSISAEMDRHYYYHLSRTDVLLQNFVPVAGLLQRHRIPFLLLKGTALEPSLYADAGFRQMNDVDLLVAKTRARDAWDLLQEEGFAALPLKSRLYRKILLQMGKHLPTLVRGDLHIDMHYALFSPEETAVQQMLFSQSVATRLRGLKLPVPHPVHHLVFLLKHLHHHELGGDSQLRLHTDILYLLHQLSTNEMLDARAFAEQTGTVRSFHRLISRICQFWAAPVAEILNPEPQERDLRHFRHFLQHPSGNSSSPAAAFARNMYQIKGLRARLLFLLGDLFPSVRFMKNRYGIESTVMLVPAYLHRLGKLWYLFLAPFNKPQDH